MERWNGRIALVTGSSSGIGAELCRHLVKYGMIVIGCARNVQRIHDITKEKDVESSPGRLVTKKCDLRNETEILTLFREIKEEFGALHVCINNAGLSQDAKLLNGETSKWRTMLDVNILALCICTREAIKLMQEKGIEDGHIIHISSMAAHSIPPGAAGHHFYCGTKHMVKALTEGHRRELKALKSKIKVTSVSPGYVRTEFLQNFSEGNMDEKLISSIPGLEVKDLANAVVYILGTPPHVEVHDILMRQTEQSS